MKDNVAPVQQCVIREMVQNVFLFVLFQSNICCVSSPPGPNHAHGCSCVQSHPARGKLLSVQQREERCWRLYSDIIFDTQCQKSCMPIELVRTFGGWGVTVWNLNSHILNYVMRTVQRRIYIMSHRTYVFKNLSSPPAVFPLRFLSFSLFVRFISLYHAAIQSDIEPHIIAIQKRGICVSPGLSHLVCHIMRCGVISCFSSLLDWQALPNSSYG